MRTPSQAGRHLPEGRTHPRRQVFSHNGVPDGKALYRQVAALKDGLSARADPFGVAAPLLHAQLAWLMHPQELSERMASLTTDLWQLRWHSFHRSVGLPSPDPVQPHADDPRFADPVWTESPTWDLVKVTPWINKFYVLDLNPKKSMVRYLLDQGLDVFITSWKNPDESMRDVSFDDYIRDGVDAIVQVAREFSGADRVHAVGYCIGGTALAIYMAWAARHFGEEAVPVRDWTLLTTLVDFHKPGDIEVFIDEGSVAHLTAQMQRKGYLDGKDMASSFRLLRSNSLVWHYVMHGWLYGEAPAPFDVLHWSMDTTRMPYAMHAWYLRELYLNNHLIQPGALTVTGEPIDLHAIRQPLYAVAAEDDHIAPWTQAFRTLHHIAADKRFVLSSSGHILGIVNPPVRPAKRRYWVGSAHRTDKAAQWRDRAEAHAGSWWDDWMAWLKPRAGELVPARPAFDERHPSLGDAPGTYVLEP